MPNFLKTPQKKADGTSKKVKPAKSRVKKAKPPKAKEKKTPKNKKAFIFLTAILVVAVTGSAAAITLLTLAKTGTSDENEPEAPAYYFSKKEELSSVTKVLGPRDFEKLDSLSSEQEESQTSGEAEPTNTGESYKYFHAADVSADLNSYKTYLEEEKNFIDVTKNSQEEKPSSHEEKLEIYQLAGPSADSGSYLCITLKEEEDGYTVTAYKGDQPWNMYIKEIWNQQKKELAEADESSQTSNTIEEAEKSVSSQEQQKLGLPEPTNSYQYIASPGIAKIDGINYYTVRTYKRQADSTLIYIATYLSDYSTGDVAFQYDEVTGEATPLP
ncbi:hypothetical protein [Lacrimispora sp.]|uniref:hypothetical protein n=1 Tax=Lacrimispora sp. TaxID=2719234 RepID=UPI0034600CCC